MAEAVLPIERWARLVFLFKKIKTNQIKLFDSGRSTLVMKTVELPRAKTDII